MSRPCSPCFVLTMPPFCTPANWLSDLPCEYKLLYPAHSIYGLESQSDFCCLPVCCTPALSCSYLLKAWAPLKTRACMLKSVFLCFPLHSTVCSSLFLCCTLLLTMDWSLFWIQSTLCFCFMFVQGLVEAQVTFNFPCNFSWPCTLSSPCALPNVGIRCSRLCLHICFL